MNYLDAINFVAVGTEVRQKHPPLLSAKLVSREMSLYNSFHVKDSTLHGNYLNYDSRKIK
jgi:hypothetical protein